MLSKSTLSFLSNLKKNNNRDWFNANKPKYELAKKEFEDFIEKAIREISRFDKTITGVKAKECVFRIYRDVRFSHDKSPYKNHFGAFITGRGKNSNGPGYYIHIEPGNCFLAGGVYQPEGSQLELIRKEIDFSLKYFKKILGHKDFIKYFGELADEGKLKTAPKGYPKDHPAIELLKHKSYIVAHKVSDKQITEDFFPYAMTIFRAMSPLNKFLNTALD
jgi:uncharacterized protein (TIGR02453 family)